MLAQKTFHDGSTEIWVWDGLAIIRRGSDIYVNEPHISGGVPILSKTDEGVRYHEHDFLGTTLWSTDTKGNLIKDYQGTTIFGEGSIQKDRSARFTGKPYDEDLQAYVFPYRNYDASTARWRSSDPAGYPDGINNQFYACVPTYDIDPLGLCTSIAGIIISRCDVKDTKTGSVVKNLGEVDRVSFGCGGAESESHTTNSQNGGSISVNLPTFFGSINATVNYGSAESITRTYKNYATCDDPSAEHTSRGAGYVPIYQYVKYDYTTTSYECGNTDYEITNSYSFLGDSGWVTTSTCEK